MLIFFGEILHAGRAAIDRQRIKRHFVLKAWVRVCWVDLGGGAEAKMKLFQNIVMLHIKLKLTMLVANILPTDTLDPGGGVKRSNYIFF